MMLGSLRTAFIGYIKYRGGEGQLSFLLHRVTGLGLLLFLTVHILDTALVYFAPHLYEHALELYRTTPFMLGEIGLVFCVLFHGLNGLRLAYIDLVGSGVWDSQSSRKSVWVAFVITLVLWIPAASIMGYKLLYYNYGFFAGK